MNCPKCKSKVFNNKGISAKNGKPYENNKCGDKNCGWIEWIDLEQPRVASAKPYRPISLLGDKIGEGQAKGAAFNKAVDVVIAAYNKGEVKFEEIPEEVVKVHEVFKKINTNGTEA